MTLSINNDVSVGEEATYNMYVYICCIHHREMYKTKIIQ